ncbi:transmembrane protein 72-like [Macrobrachium rosenbergii]|uniref:transmembrane protein 72-like n=1 Tax=Macrobrachium rosenbergii TaxID=79674 RepID=UPI0034D6092D
MSYEDIRCRCFWENLPYCARLLGVATSVVLWGVGVDMVYHHHTLGAYILALSITVLFLEITWTVTLFLRVCVRNENSGVLHCWSKVLWFDTWKKAVVYWICAGAILIKPHTLWLTSAAGGMLISLGFLHLLLVYKKKLEAKEALLEAKEDSYDSRYEEEVESSPVEINTEAADQDSSSAHDYVLQV